MFHVEFFDKTYRKYGIIHTFTSKENLVFSRIDVRIINFFFISSMNFAISQ